MSCDQNTPTPFLHCQRPGDGHGFIELVFHTGTVGRGDCDFEVNRVLRQSIFLVSDCLVHSHELLVSGPPNLKRGGVDGVELRTMWVRYMDASRWYFSSREPRLAKLATRTTSISTGGVAAVGVRLPDVMSRCFNDRAIEPFGSISSSCNDNTSTRRAAHAMLQAVIEAHCRQTDLSIR